MEIENGKTQKEAKRDMTVNLDRRPLVQHRAQVLGCTLVITVTALYEQLKRRRRRRGDGG